MRPLWGNPKKNASASIGLLAVPVGIKQTELVDKMVIKFLASEFVVMLFHYDGNVDEWKNYTWYNQVIHVSALNQTKWWFAKRFLHPDIVSEYRYIFIWDEDLGVDSFDPINYVSIVESEGLEISQPALDVAKSEVHHLITARWKKSRVHRRAFKHGVNGTGCDNSSRTPPCTGWIEVMAPVFSRAAWRCVWYMIQNDLVHAWGLDKQLGNCAQGDPTKNIGVVDAEYIIHYGRPTLGDARLIKVWDIRSKMQFFALFGHDNTIYSVFTKPVVVDAKNLPFQLKDRDDSSSFPEAFHQIAFVVDLSKILDRGAYVATGTRLWKFTDPKGCFN